MNIKDLLNKSVYGTIGYISSEEDLRVLEIYIQKNQPVLQHFKTILVATNYKDNLDDLDLINRNIDLWEKYFPNNCYLIDNELNRGHNFGTADLDNILVDWCKKNNEEWLCKSTNDVILTTEFLEKEIGESDFYYLNGIGYGGMEKYNYDLEKVKQWNFFPQSNFYIINVSKIDFLNDKEYLNKTYQLTSIIPNYNGKIWEYIPGWSCESFLANCVERNKLTKEHLISDNTYSNLLKVVYHQMIHDPSHKNLFLDGICHFHYPSSSMYKI